MACNLGVMLHASVKMMAVVLGIDWKTADGARTPGIDPAGRYTRAISLDRRLIPVIIVLPGLVAVALLPDLDDGDTALPLLATGLLPIGLRGIFVAAFLAALMSSLDSYLNAAATIFTNDFYERFRKVPSSSSETLTVGRWTTLVLVAWAIGFAFWVSTIEGSGIYVIFRTLMSFFQGPALAILLMGVLLRRANATGALVGFLSGVGCAVGLFVLNQPTVLDWLGWQPLFRIEEPFFYFSVWAFVTAATLHAVVSLLTPAQPLEQIAPLLYRSGNQRVSQAEEGTRNR